jgi:excinuclease ABC subunit C
MDILEKIRTISSKPGVYVMKDAGGGIIYIGKAKNLRKRVSSYFHKRPDLPRLAALVQGVSDIETVITDNEVPWDVSAVRDLFVAAGLDPSSYPALN